MLRCAVMGLLVAASPAFGQVYKCKDAAGKQVFSDVPCGASAQTVNVKPSRGAYTGEVDPNIERQLSGLEERQRVRDAENARLDRIREMNRPIDNMNRDANQRRCSNLRRELDTAEATVKNGAVHWQYNRAKASIPALQNQIARDC